MRSRFCKACAGWHPADAPWPIACIAYWGEPAKRSDQPAPMLIRDGMDPIRSMADGQLYDSKRAYERGVRAAGCEIAGNDKAPFERRPTWEPQGVGQDISDVIDKLQAR
jgi:hypothetical protein